MKSVEKILEYQKVIESIVSKKSCDVYEIENICLCRIGHVACYESFCHALEDLISNGRVKCFQDIITNAN